uniref:Uncharacterized protein n=1 Tax=Phaeocystis antarctica TaxID=33657 RepID=A0A6T7UJB7_9EUKA
MKAGLDSHSPMVNQYGHSLSFRSRHAASVTAAGVSAVVLQWPQAWRQETLMKSGLRSHSPDLDHLAQSPPSSRQISLSPSSWHSLWMECVDESRVRSTRWVSVPSLARSTRSGLW